MSVEINLHNVSKYYQDGEKSAKGIENVTLDFKTDGSFVVITGESGAGKTTLIKVLTGLEDFDEGDILFDGIPLSGMSEEERHEIYSKNISFVFQDYNLIESFSAKENILLALIRSGLDKKSAEKKAVEVLKQVGLEKQINYRTSKLSGGERQRVAIARSLALESKVIIFDEPTGNLDVDTSKEIINLIQSVKKDRLIIYVTHEYQQVQEYVNRHIILKDGNVLSDSIIKEVKSDEKHVEIESKNRKYGLKGKIFSSILFAFRRPGRFVATFFILFLTALSCFGISTINCILYGGLDFLMYSQITGNGVGNEVLVKKNDINSSDILDTSEYFVDNFDFFQYSRFNIFDYSKKEKIKQDTYYSSIYNGYLLPYLSTDYKEASFNLAQNEYSIYAVLNSEYQGSTTEDIIKEYVGTEIALLPLELDYSYKKYSSHISASKFETNVFDKSPKFILSGIYYCTDDKMSLNTCFYTPNIESVKTLHEICEFLYLNSTDYFTVYNDSVQISDYTDNITIDVKSDDISFTFSQNSKLFNNYFYLDKYWEDKKDQLTFSFNGFEIPLSKMKNIKYYDDHLPERTYKVSYSSPIVFSKELIDQNYLQRYYFKDRNQVSSFTTSLDKNTYSYEVFDKRTVSRIQLGSFADFSTFEKISLIDSTVFLIFILYGILVLIRKILNNFYYRKSNDQMILSYIGYKFKDILLINLTQFLTITLISNIIIYPLFLTLIPLVFDYFSQLSGIFIFSLIIDILFSIYLSMPIRKRRK